MKMNHPKTDYYFFRTVCNIAVPVTLQSMLQSSFSVIDQIMIGQLGSSSIAGVGLAGKFSSIFSVLVSSIAAVSGIMIAQYMGKKDVREVRRSFFINLYAALGLALLFTFVCALFPEQIMSIYTKDVRTCQYAAGYLQILTITYLPIAASTLIATLLRCRERASLSLFASIAAAILNTGLNYILIFGKLGITPMGVSGAAIATAISQAANFIILFFLFYREIRPLNISPDIRPLTFVSFDYRQYLGMLLPVFACEFLWSLGENVYAGIYGRMGTTSCAAMTLTIPVQTLTIGALSGLSQAAGIIIGKELGHKEFDSAYNKAKQLMMYGIWGSAILSVLILLTGSYYVKIYHAENAVLDTTYQILIAYALIAPFKVQNMILGGGIIRSGGKTKYIMWIDFIGTWFFGVPLGLLAAFVWKLQIPYVYFILSLEECVRFGISLVIFVKRKWMQSF